MRGGRKKGWVCGMSFFARMVCPDQHIVYSHCIAYYYASLADATSTTPMPQFSISREVKCQIMKLSNVCIPAPSITSYPSTSSDDGALEDWNINMSALFEWMGMACLGSQRYSSFILLVDDDYHVSRTTQLNSL
jgi:hypothetical protein